MFEVIPAEFHKTLIKIFSTTCKFRENLYFTLKTALVKKKQLGLLNESHPRVFQTIFLSFLIAF